MSIHKASAEKEFKQDTGQIASNLVNRPVVLVFEPPEFSSSNRFVV